MYDVVYVFSDLNREGIDLLLNVVERVDFFCWYEVVIGIEIDLEVCCYY